MILKLILNTELMCQDVDQDLDRRRALLNTVMNPRIQKKKKISLVSERLLNSQGHYSGGTRVG
jgi:hypothetical protein